MQRGQHTPGPLDAVREAADAALVDLLEAPPCAGSRRTAADAAAHLSSRLSSSWMVECRLRLAAVSARHISGFQVYSGRHALLRVQLNTNS